MNESEKFSNRLLQLLEKNHLSARKLSISLGYNEGYINRIINKKSYPNVVNFFEICKVLGITPKEFFDYDNESPDTTRQLLEALTKIDKETLVHLTAIVMALSKK